MTMKVLLTLLIALCSQVQGAIILKDERTCLPQPSAVVPIQGSVKNAARLALCDTNSGKLTRAFSEFLAREIVKTFQSPSKNCTLSNVQEESCDNHGRNNRRISFKFTANLACGDGCDSEHSSDQQALELIHSKHDDLRAMFRTKSSAEVRYVGRTVVLHYFHGKKGVVSTNCETSVVRSIKKYPLCECPESCPQGNPQTVTDVCTLPPVTGRCRAAIPRYFYNSTSQQCEVFVYGGCGGNDNNFDTEKDCQSKCKAAGKKPECPNGKEHTVCGSACPATCDTKDKLISCTQECVSGCFCPPGTFELGDECVTEDQCPTESPATESVTDKECPKGKVFHECGSACPKTCENKNPLFCTLQCVRGCFCPPDMFERGDECVTEDQCPTESPATESVTDKECPKGKVFHECGSACPKTCENKNPLFCTLQCVRGCFCPPDMFELGDECVTEDQCPTESPTTVLVATEQPECPKGKIFNNCGTACPKTCEDKNPSFCTFQCVTGCFCPPDKFELGDECVTEDQCPTESPATESATTEPKCPEGMEYSVCGSACPKTCENKDQIIPCTTQCVQGCFCPADKFLSGGMCVSAKECK